MSELEYIYPKKMPLKRSKRGRQGTKLAKKVSDIKTLKRKAWEAISRYIRKRDEKRGCYTCETGKAEHCGHFLRNTERNQQLGGNALWYDERNFAGQCVKCNSYNGGEQAVFATRIAEAYGSRRLTELQILWRTSKKWTREEIQEIIVSYTAKYEALLST